MESQFGIVNVWSQGDIVTKSVALLLLAMSLSSWLVIIFKTLALFKYKKFTKEVRNFWHAKNFSDGISKLDASQSNPFRYMALEGKESLEHHEKVKEELHDSLDISDWTTRNLRYCIDEFTAKIQSGLAILASVGSTAPFVGLFGTVWGIYHALIAIGLSGQSSIDKVAGPIGEALIMTAFGLAVAIPAVLGYNAIVRGNKSVLNVLNSFAHDLHAYFVTGARVTSDNQNNKILSIKKNERKQA